MVITSSWSEETHPGTFDHVDDAHFSDMAGATHSTDFDFWKVGELASPGMAQMAVFGEVTIFAEEAEAAKNSGKVGSIITDDRQLRPPGSVDFEFSVTDDKSAFTFVSMIGPSPDWFIGVGGMPLLIDGTWLQSSTVELITYDGGLRDNNVLEMLGPETTPQAPIKLKQGFPLGGDVVGTLTSTRIQ